MVNNPKARTATAIEKMMQEMQHLVDHPRIQQRNWVARGRVWIPILKQAHEDLQSDVQQHDFVLDAHQALLSSLASVGLKVEKRDTTTWGYRWHDGNLEGAYPTQAAAVEAGLRARL